MPSKRYLRRPIDFLNPPRSLPCSRHPISAPGRGAGTEHCCSSPCRRECAHPSSSAYAVKTSPLHPPHSSAARERDGSFAARRFAKTRSPSCALAGGAAGTAFGSCIPDHQWIGPERRCIPIPYRQARRRCFPEVSVVGRETRHASRAEAHPGHGSTSPRCRPFGDRSLTRS
jgi:hypothetical protein